MASNASAAAEIAERPSRTRGHHYVEGFGPAPAAEAAAFRDALPDFYAAFTSERDPGAPELPTGALLAGVGFTAGARPDWDAMSPMAETR